MISRVYKLLLFRITRLRFSLGECYNLNIKYSCVNKKYRYVYFRVPKAANTTVVSSLLSHDPEKDKVGIRKKSFDDLSCLIFSNISDFKVFTVVRNPYTRILSTYLQKIKNGSKRHLVNKNGDVTFDEFISYLEQGGLEKNGHWMPQHKIVPLSFSGLQVIKMENLETDFGKLLSEIDDNMKLNIQRTHSTGSDNLISSYYTPDLLDRVYSLYEFDFMAFSYDRLVK